MSRYRLRYTGDRDLITWEGNVPYRNANGGMGMCNLGSGKRINCVLGGIGCDVDHVAIARDNLGASPGGYWKQGLDFS